MHGNPVFIGNATVSILRVGDVGAGVCHFQLSPVRDRQAASVRFMAVSDIAYIIIPRGSDGRALAGDGNRTAVTAIKKAIGIAPVTA